MNRLLTGETTSGPKWSSLSQKPALWGLILALLVVVVYAPTLTHPFVFDDVPELLFNLDILSARNCLDTVSRSANTGLSGRPVACLTFAANVAMGGFSVRGFHVVNITIHVLSAVVLFAVVRRTAEKVRQNKAPSSGLVPISFLNAALWALHPLQTESVTYIIQRIESLAGLFYLLTLYCAIRSRDSKSWLWPVASVLSCILGMLTKEIVVTAPLVVYVYDKVFEKDQRFWWPRPLHLALAGTWIVSVLLIIQSPRGGSAGFGLGVSALDYLRTQAQVIVHYLRLVFWPFPQAISYADWAIVREWPPAIIPGALILLLLIATIVGVFRRRWWGFCGAWFFLILSPSSSFVPIVTEPAAERRMYLPLAAVIVVLIGGAASIRRLLPISASSPGRIGKGLGFGLGFLAILACVSATVARNEQYRTSIGNLSSTLEVRSEDELIRAALVEELVRANRLDEARRIHEAGLTRNPNSHVLYDNWARAMIMVGRYDEAIAAFSKAIAIVPSNTILHGGLGSVLLEAGKFTEALTPLREALRLSPENYTARTNLGVALARLGRIDEAIVELRQAVHSKPGYAGAQFNLGSLLVYQGHTDEGIKHLQIAVRLHPDDEQYRLALQDAQNLGSKSD